MRKRTLTQTGPLMSVCPEEALVIIIQWWKPTETMNVVSTCVNLTCCERNSFPSHMIGSGQHYAHYQCLFVLSPINVISTRLKFLWRKSYIALNMLTCKWFHNYVFILFHDSSPKWPPGAINMCPYLSLHHGSLNTTRPSFFQFGPEAKRCDFYRPELGLGQDTLQKDMGVGVKVRSSLM